MAQEITRRTKKTLIMSARSGNAQAFAELMVCYDGLARCIIGHWVSDKDTAQELVQEVALQAYLSLDGLRKEERFSSWFQGIILNVCRSHHREARARARREQRHLLWERAEAAAAASDACDPQIIIEEQEKQRIVRAAVNSLSPDQREAVLLFYYEQLSLQEITEKVGASLTAIKSRLHKARKKLQARLMSEYPEIPHFVLTKQRRKRMARVSVQGVWYSEGENVHSVILQAEADDRRMLIYVGGPEAVSIALGLEKFPMARPMTMDFTHNLLRAIGTMVEEVRIESLQDETFYAIVKLKTGHENCEIDARPSDAVALAVRSGCPIYAADGLLRHDIGAPEENGYLPIIFNAAP